MTSPLSAGDLIAISILIKDLVRAFDDSRGSAAEYQEVIRELWSLDKALLEVEHLSRTCETTVELNALSCVARRAGEQCRLCISAFLDNIKTYNRSLGRGGSGKRLRDAAKRIQWTFAQKDELAKFRTEINGHVSAINMLLITASLNLTSLTARNTFNRLTEAEKKDEASTSATTSILSDIQTRLVHNTTQLEIQSKLLDSQEQARSMLMKGIQYFSTLSSELKGHMNSILTASRDNFNVLHDVQSRIPREFKPCWIQEPVVFTDALGRIMPIHIELINSWKVFDKVLAARFVRLPGERKIARKEVAFQDRYMAKDFERCDSFDACFLPGRRIDMSMVFKQRKPCTSCPKCGLEAEMKSEGSIQCTRCALWLQRIEEIADDSADDTTSASRTCSPLANVSKENRTSRKRKRATTSNEEGDDIRAFQRVRLLLKLRRSSDTSQSKSLKGQDRAGLKNSTHHSRAQPYLGSPEDHDAKRDLAELVSIYNVPIEDRELDSTYDLSRFLHGEDGSTQQPQQADAQSPGGLYDHLFDSGTVLPFPNPYDNIVFEDWLLGNQDLDPLGNNYLSTLLASSDETPKWSSMGENIFQETT